MLAGQNAKFFALLEVFKTYSASFFGIAFPVFLGGNFLQIRPRQPFSSQSTSLSAQADHQGNEQNDEADANDYDEREQVLDQVVVARRRLDCDQITFLGAVMAQHCLHALIFDHHHRDLDKVGKFAARHRNRILTLGVVDDQGRVGTHIGCLHVVSLFGETAVAAGHHRKVDNALAGGI